LREYPARLKASVIFSSYNGAGRLPRTLDSLVAQSLPVADWELVAVDNASTDGTRALLESYAGRLPIRVLSQPVPGKSGALNLAIESARGELLVFTDDDVAAEPDWLSALVACAEAEPDYGVFGGAILPDWERPPDGLRFMEWIPKGSTYAIVEEPGGPCAADRIWGPNTAIRRGLIGESIRFREDIGPLPGGRFAMGEDIDIVLQLARRGARAYRCAEAVVHHLVPATSMSEQWVQARAERLGYGMPAVHPDMVPEGPRLGGVPLVVWVQSAGWALRSALLSPLPNSRLKFWAIWKTRYMAGYRAGIRRYAAPARRAGGALAFAPADRAVQSKERR
jgi:glycosyltransferase involved in cell wall biosynthesis